MMEMLVIAVVAILVLGPEKLPSTIVDIAKIIKALKNNIDSAKESIDKELRLSALKEENEKYKAEFDKIDKSLRKKLSFEEFDELKADVQKSLREDKNKDIAKENEDLAYENLDLYSKEKAKNPLEEEKSLEKNEAVKKADKSKPYKNSFDNPRQQSYEKGFEEDEDEDIESEFASLQKEYLENKNKQGYKNKQEKIKSKNISSKKADIKDV